MDGRFSKKYRLTENSQFRHVFTMAKKLKGRYLRCYWCHNDLSYIRLGIVVSKKFGKAYRRNHFKRLVREAFRTIPQRLEVGLDIVVLPSFSSKSASSTQISTELLFLIEKAKSYRIND